MTPRLIAIVALAAGSAGLLPGAAQAQDGPRISVGAVTSAETCTLYREYAGRVGAIVTPYGAAAYASWRSWLVKDCVNNLASLKMSLQAALASAGGVRVQGAGGRYPVTARLSSVSGGGDRHDTQCA